MKIKPIFLLLTLSATLLVSGCSVRYSFSGASIDYSLSKTISIQYINNMAALVAPILSSTVTDELTTKIQRETKLQFVQEDADISFAGEIIDYRSDPISISANETAQQHRLTIAVRIRFVNKAQPNFSFERVFSNYGDYPSDRMLTSVEGSLIPEITQKIVEDVFNAAFANW